MQNFVVPKLQAAGWENSPFSIAEQRYFTNPKGRIRVVGGQIVRGKPKRADYLLRYRRDFPIAVVEAKADYKTPGAALGQAKEYAQILDLKFAYATNGKGIVEFDFTTGIERSVDSFPDAGGALDAAERESAALCSCDGEGSGAVLS